MIFLSFHGSAAVNKDVNIPFDLINGLTIIQAEIDGVKGNFLFDTGSDGIFLNGITKANPQQSIVSLGGISAISTTILNELKVGTYSQYDLEAQIMSLAPIEEHLGIELQGIIGGQLFQPRVIKFDFKESNITLLDKIKNREKTSFDNKVNIQIIKDIPVAKVRIEKKWYHFALDTGSSVHFIDTKVLSVLSNVESTSDNCTIKCLANKNTELQKISISSFMLGNALFKNQICVPHSFEVVNKTTQFDLDGVISLSKLIKGTVVIDYTRSKLYF